MPTDTVPLFAMTVCIVTVSPALIKVAEFAQVAGEEVAFTLAPT